MLPQSDFTEVGFGFLHIFKYAWLFKVLPKYGIQAMEHSAEFELRTNQVHGAEIFLRSRQLLSYSKMLQNFMEPDESTPNHSILFLKGSF
jgi:hypothetical protein